MKTLNSEFGFLVIFLYLPEKAWGRPGKVNPTVVE